jgi:hypothetical protein
MPQRVHPSAIVAPRDDDWVVTLVGPDGSVAHRRISAGPVDQGRAEDVAIKSTHLPREFFRSVSSRRWNDRTIVAP